MESLLATKESPSSNGQLKEHDNVLLLCQYQVSLIFVLMQDSMVTICK